MCTCHSYRYRYPDRIPFDSIFSFQFPEKMLFRGESIRMLPPIPSYNGTNPDSIYNERLEYPPISLESSYERQNQGHFYILGPTARQLTLTLSIHSLAMQISTSTIPYPHVVIGYTQSWVTGNSNHQMSRNVSKECTCSLQKSANQYITLSIQSILM